MYKVLIVDDETLILNGLKNLIDWQEIGLVIESSALNGEEALTKFIEKPVDIVVTDISMPKMNGLELIENIQKINSKVKFIILSGYDDFIYAKKAIKLGIENYILKPINEEELQATLQNIVVKLNASADDLSIEEKRLQVLKDNILYRWSTNNISNYELEERALILGCDLSSAYYTSAIVTLDRADQDIERIQNAYKYLNRKICNSTECLFFQDVENNINFIFSGCDIEVLKSRIKLFFDNFLNDFKNNVNVPVFVTVGSIEKSYKNLYRSYSAAKKLQDYILIYGYDKAVYYYEKIRDIKNLSLDNSYTKEFNKILLNKDLEEINYYIDNVFEKLRNSDNADPSYIQNTAILMILTINNVLKELNINSSNTREDFKDMLLKIVKLRTIEEIKQAIKDKCLEMIRNIKENNNSTSPVIQQIISYIKNNYNKEISLKTLSQKFNINSSYLGQVFHKETGEQFSDYINRIRNEKAKEMLLNTNMKVNEIAESIGYSDTSYFYRKFKDFFGISPNAMRSSKNYKL